MISPPLIVVDGSSYLFRAYYALPNLTNPAGQPTGAIYGVLTMLRRLLKDYSPEHIVVVFDTKTKNFRHTLYEKYKANRLAMPDDLALQITPLHEMIKLLGIPLLMQEAVEADDLIGTLATKAALQHKEVLLITADKDFVQLLSPHIKIFDTMKNVAVDATYIQAKLAILPEQMVDFLALTGDSADNIPGIPQVGPKTAAKWLAQYGSLNNILSHAADIPGKVGEMLRHHRSQAELARQLVTIVCNLDLPFSLDDFSLQAPDEAGLRSYYEQFGFTTWLKDLPVKTMLTTKEHYQCLDTLEKWHAFKRGLATASHFALDTETTGLDPMRAELVGIAFAYDQEAAYLPLNHTAAMQLDLEAVRSDLTAILVNPNSQKIMQNGKYDLKVLHRAGFSVMGFSFDTMLASYVLNSTANRHDLASLAKRELGLDSIAFTEVAGKGRKQISFAEVGLKEATDYATEDTDLTLKLYHHFQAKLAAEPRLSSIFTSIEMPLSQVLFSMELRGVLIDKVRLQAHSAELSIRIAALEAESIKLAGMPFNLSSPKQLLQVLYDKMQLPIVKKTPTGQPSTDEDTLQELARLKFPLPELILTHRHLNKLKSTYTDKLPELIHPDTGRIHTQYQQAVAVTGRLSSTDPNLQNIPMKTAEGRKIRQAFIAPPGYTILAADYSQIELRIMAHLSGDASLVKAFQDHKDIHRATAAEILGIAEEAVTLEDRRQAKAVNFGLIYGMSAFGLAKQLGVSRREAEQYVAIYFDRYPGVKAYMNQTRERARTQGYVETLLGRRLYLPEINAKNALQRKAAERAAINAPMQGSAADIIKLAMIALHQVLHAKTNGQQDLFNSIEAHMIMQVHDELVFEVNTAHLNMFREVVQQKMENVMSLRVPLVVNLGIGSNWDEAHS